MHCVHSLLLYNARIDSFVHAVARNTLQADAILRPGRSLTKSYSRIQLRPGRSLSRTEWNSTAAKHNSSSSERETGASAAFEMPSEGVARQLHLRGCCQCLPHLQDGSLTVEPGIAIGNLRTAKRSKTNEKGSLRSRIKCTSPNREWVQLETPKEPRTHAVRP
eukprot:4226001-Amphidinium_carterae.2